MKTKNHEMKWMKWNETTHDLKRQWQSSNEWPDERTTDRTDYRHLRTRTTRLWCEMIKMGERERTNDMRWAIDDIQLTIGERWCVLTTLECFDGRLNESNGWMFWEFIRYMTHFSYFWGPLQIKPSPKNLDNNKMLSLTQSEDDDKVLQLLYSQHTQAHKLNIFDFNSISIWKDVYFS